MFARLKKYLFLHPLNEQNINGPFVYRLGRMVFIHVRGGVRFPTGYNKLGFKKPHLESIWQIIKVL